MKVTARLRALLVELEPLCRQFDRQTAEMQTTDVQYAVELGYQREQTRSMIAALAYRINEESNGTAARKRKEAGEE